MLTEMSLKEALKYFMKGRKVLVLNEYDDKSISAERIEDCLPKEWIHKLHGRALGHLKLPT